MLCWFNVLGDKDEQKMNLKSRDLFLGFDSIIYNFYNYEQEFQPLWTLFPNT